MARYPTESHRISRIGRWLCDRTVEWPESIGGRRKTRADGQHVIHAGVDLGGRADSDVRAPASGRVVVAEWDGEGSRRGKSLPSPWRGYDSGVVVIREERPDSPTGELFHVLAHTRRPKKLDESGATVPLRVGDEVREGDVVAEVGSRARNPRNPLTPHVHWEVRTVLVPDYSRGQWAHEVTMDPVAWTRGELRPFKPSLLSRAALEAAVRAGRPGLLPGEPLVKQEEHPERDGGDGEESRPFADSGLPPGVPVPKLPDPLPGRPPVLPGDGGTSWGTIAVFALLAWALTRRRW